MREIFINDNNLKIEDLDYEVIRVKGLVVNSKNEVLIAFNNNTYQFPGGHVELDEDTDMAVKREMQEELGYPIKVKKLIAINQNFFKTEEGKPFHEIGFYYIVEAEDETNVNPNDYTREELDKGKIQHLEFKWSTLDELKRADFMPHFVPTAIENKNVLINITRD